MVFSGSSGFFRNKTDRHDITDIVLKVALNTTKQTNKQSLSSNDNGLGGVNIIVHASSAILLGCGLEPRSNDLVRNIKEQGQQLVGSHDNVPYVGNICRPYPLYHLYLVAI